ncbi:MAG TPA: glycosyltransferase 87 family protein [Stellaceae bacterium]|nr:glycosyltransferase 87 family protein [Stellaceae bacterium]
MVRVVVAWVVVSLAVFALQEVPRGHGAWTLAGAAVVAGSLPLLLAFAERTRAPPSPATRTGLIWTCCVFALAQLGFALMRTAKLKIIDVGATTVAAIDALAQGGNPYALPIDAQAGDMAAGGAAFHGYKYLPVMMAVYAPLCLALGMRGIVVTNIVLQGATAASLRALAGRGGGAVAGYAAAAIYLSLPFLAFQLFTRGVNDLAALLPLLLALLLLERRPFWAGVLTGLSLGTKLMPALAVLPCLVPPPGARRRYFAGVAVGLLPVVPIVLAAPGAFADNILLFNALRPVDDTSWLYGMPGAVAIAARAVALVGLAVLYVQVWRRSLRLEARAAACAAAILMVFAVGPDMHHNYYLWFIPFLAPLAARAAIGVNLEAPLERMRDTA